jgi:hypothetical protein
MPLARLMGDAVLLPDGTVFLCNGAAFGVDSVCLLPPWATGAFGTVASVRWLAACLVGLLGKVFALLVSRPRAAAFFALLALQSRPAAFLFLFSSCLAG